MEELNLKHKNYLKHYASITKTFVSEVKAKNEQDIAEAVKLAEIRLSEIYAKAVDEPLNDENAPTMAKIKAGELGLSVIMNLLMIQYDGNKLFNVLTKGLNVYGQLPALPALNE
jgi:hypothetical protein